MPTRFCTSSIRPLHSPRPGDFLQVGFFSGIELLVALESLGAEARQTRGGGKANHFRVGGPFPQMIRSCLGGFVHETPLTSCFLICKKAQAGTPERRTRRFATAGALVVPEPGRGFWVAAAGSGGPQKSFGAVPVVADGRARLAGVLEGRQEGSQGSRYSAPPWIR